MGKKEINVPDCKDFWHRSEKKHEKWNNRPVSEKKKNNNYKRSSVLGWRLIPISWYIDSDLQGELILASAPASLHCDPTAVRCGAFRRNKGRAACLVNAECCEKTVGGGGRNWSKVEGKKLVRMEERAKKCLTDMGQSGEHQERWTVRGGKAFLWGVIRTWSADGRAGRKGQADSWRDKTEILFVWECVCVLGGRGDVELRHGDSAAF